jgi:hypothetical protein
MIVMPCTVGDRQVPSLSKIIGRAASSCSRRSISPDQLLALCRVSLYRPLLVQLFELWVTVVAVVALRAAAVISASYRVVEVMMLAFGGMV